MLSTIPTLELIELTSTCGEGLAVRWCSAVSGLALFDTSYLTFNIFIFHI